MKGFQSLNCASKDSRLGTFDIHLDKMDRPSGLTNEFIKGDRRDLKRAEIVAWEQWARDEGNLPAGKIKADIAREVRDCFSPYHHILDAVQPQVFFQDSEICGKRFEGENRPCGPNKSRKEKRIKSALCANVQNPRSRENIILKQPDTFPLQKKKGKFFINLLFSPHPEAFQHTAARKY